MNFVTRVCMDGCGIFAPTCVKLFIFLPRDRIGQGVNLLKKRMYCEVGDFSCLRVSLRVTGLYSLCSLSRHRSREREAASQPCGNDPIAQVNR